MTTLINNFAGLSTSLGLNAFPAIDENKYPDIFAALVKITNGIRALQQYVDQYTSPIIVAITSEIINPGAMVNFFNSGGVITAQNASALNGTKPAHAFSQQGLAVGAQGNFQSIGVNPFISGMTPGTEYFLSDATPGNIVNGPPVTAGHLVQSVGVAISDSQLMFLPARQYKQL